MNDSKKDQTLLLAILVVILISLNYNFLDEKFAGFLEDSETGIVERVIDGDTIVLDNEEHVRLLGINTPEKREYLHDEAQNFLSENILGKNVSLEFGKQKIDRYNRTLAYVFLGNKNINLESVKNGFSNYYFPSGKDIYYDDFYDAWEICVNNNINLCF